jgi:hypothetical protein
MSNADTEPTGSIDSLEREKWAAERAFREREIAVDEREQVTKEAQLALAQKEQAASRWKSPLVVAILAAAVAALGNAIVAYTNDASQTRLESQKSEQARILEMIKTGSPDKAAENLRFLLNAGLIRDSGVRRDLTRFLNNRKPGSGPALPSAAASRFVSQLEGTNVPASDLAPIRSEIHKLVTVPLTTNQETALISFVYNVGLGAFRERMLQELNAGRYAEVPKEMMKWTRLGGTVLPGLVARRRSEAALWNTP